MVTTVGPAPSVVPNASKPVTFTGRADTSPNKILAPEPLLLVGPFPVKTQVAALTPVTTADATDLNSAIALANANKAKINAVIAALKA